MFVSKLNVFTRVGCCNINEHSNLLIMIKELGHDQYIQFFCRGGLRGGGQISCNRFYANLLVGVNIKWATETCSHFLTKYFYTFQLEMASLVVFTIADCHLKCKCSSAKA